MSRKEKPPEVVEDQDLDQASGGSTTFAGGIYVSAGDVSGSATIQPKIVKTPQDPEGAR